MWCATFTKCFSKSVLEGFKSVTLPSQGFIYRAYTLHNHLARNNLCVEYREGRLVGDDANEASVSEYHVLQRLDVPRENEKCMYMGVVGLDGKCRETGYDRRRQSAVKWKPELRHIIDIWRELSVWGPLNYEQHSPFGTDPSGTVDIPDKIPCWRRAHFRLT